MPTAADIIRRRRERQAKRARTVMQKSRRSAIAVFSVISIAVSLAAIGLAVLYNDFTRDLPSLEYLPLVMDPDTGFLAAPTTIVDRSGEIPLAELGASEEDAAYLSIHSRNMPSAPQVLTDAMIAALDPGFHSHPGFYRTTILAGERDTIPLKLVSELLFWREIEGSRRWVREGLLAAQLVDTFGREQVLEWYLNSADFGYERFGIEAAARWYFGKSASRLSLPEAATLAAVAQAPDLNPFDTPDLTLARRDQTLQQMLGLEMITQQQVIAAMSTPLGVRLQPEVAYEETDAFVRFVRQQVEQEIPAAVLARGGLTIYSTLDLDVQLELYCTLDTQLRRLASGDSLLPENCQAARLLPSLTTEGMQQSDFSGEGVVMDPRTSQILALVAGNSVSGARAAIGTHAPGSILTPYVYLTALTRGLSAGSLVWDIPAFLPPGTASSPNLDGEFHGPMRIRTALAGDYLVPALNLVSQFSPTNIWHTAALSGLPSLSGETGTMLLEGGALSLVEITHAYSAFSTQGVIIGYPDATSLLDPVPLQPTAVLRVVDQGGRTWLDLGPPEARPVMSAALAYTLNHILSDETARWDALGHPNVLEVGRPAGVKMGFTQDQSSVWTVGYTPQVAVGVWLGSDDSLPGADESAPSSPLLDPRAAAGVWHAVLKYAARDHAPDGWSMPQGIVELDVCEPSGLLPTADCPVVIREIFLQGSEPVQADTLYRRFEINRETGLLATVFTPAGLIEPRVFFVPPAEALSWAQQAGMDIPPENYDLVSQPPPPDPDTIVQTPQMFAYVSGRVPVIGTAGGSGFQSYSVQVGKGLNPQQWLQLGEVLQTPVRDDVLAEWDTSGLNGLYAIRLLVVRENNLVETHIIQVTVDNQPPDLEILYPQAGQVFAYPADSSITVQLSAADNLLLERIDLSLDDRLIQTITQPPFAFSLNLLPGSHVLRAEAFDFAGNSSVVEYTIEVNR